MKTKSEISSKSEVKSSPKMPRGKGHSRSKGLKHRFYREELVVSEADEHEFQEMRVGLKAQLNPRTVLQSLAFEDIVGLSWHCRLAQRKSAHQLKGGPDKSSPDEAPDIDGVLKSWYGSSRLDIRRGIRALEYAINEFCERGYFQEETKAFLKRGFGVDFLHLLEDWTPPMSKDAMLLAEQLARHRKVFGKTPDTEIASLSESAETTKVVRDPKQNRQMVCKLLEERKNFLQELLTVMPMRGVKLDAAPSSEFNSWFVVNRELRLAVNWYSSLQKNHR